MSIRKNKAFAEQIESFAEYIFFNASEWSIFANDYERLQS